MIQFVISAVKIKSLSVHPQISCFQFFNLFNDFLFLSLPLCVKWIENIAWMESGMMSSARWPFSPLPSHRWFPSILVGLLTQICTKVFARRQKWQLQHIAIFWPNPTQPHTPPSSYLSSHGRKCDSDPKGGDYIWSGWLFSVGQVTGSPPCGLAFHLICRGSLSPHNHSHQISPPLSLSQDL